MKIGIFDSGLGGLLIAKAIHRKMPEYDYVYLGDTKRVPYGNRSHDTVYEFTRQCVDHLFRKENCTIVILACNTASARALKDLQKKYLPKNFPDRKILGVLVPAAEEAAKFNKVGILATAGTVASESFPKEIKKVNRNSKIFQNAAPMLVSLAEEGERKLAVKFIQKYLKPLLIKKPKAIVLGCTHYPFFKKEIKKILGKKVKLISQDEIIPPQLKNYIRKHPETAKHLSKNGNIKVLVTDMTQNVKALSEKWFGNINAKRISIENK